MPPSLSVGPLFYLLAATLPLAAQPARTQLQALVRQQGEVFVAVQYTHAERAEACRLEDLFTNTVAFAGDTLLVAYDNYTESFCEATKLETRLQYRVPLAALDPARTALGQRNYNLRAARLLEGQATWYELHLHTRHDRPAVAEHDVLQGETRRTDTFRLLFRTQAGARQAQALLRGLLK